MEAMTVEKNNPPAVKTNKNWSSDMVGGDEDDNDDASGGASDAA
jgi:hypothetical protein